MWRKVQGLPGLGWLACKVYGSERQDSSSRLGTQKPGREGGSSLWKPSMPVHGRPLVVM